jgi:hypothetical protein
VIAVVAMCINFVLDGIFYSHGKLMQSMSTEFGTNLATVAVLGSLQVTVCFFVCVLSTGLINRFSLRWVGAVGSVICAAGKRSDNKFFAPTVYSLFQDSSSQRM